MGLCRTADRCAARVHRFQREPGPQAPLLDMQQARRGCRAAARSSSGASNSGDIRGRRRSGAQRATGWQPAASAADRPSCRPATQPECSKGPGCSKHATASTAYQQQWAVPTTIRCSEVQRVERAGQPTRSRQLLPALTCSSAAQVAACSRPCSGPSSSSVLQRSGGST